MAGINSQDIDDNVTIQDPSSGDQVGITPSNRMKVDATFTTDPDDIAACPVMSNNYRIEYDDNEKTVPSSFATMYSYSGTGRFYGFVQNYDDDDTEVRLLIDGQEIFRLCIDQMKDMVLSDDILMCKTLFAISNDGQKLEFCPPCAIRFTSSVLIQARRTDSSNNDLESQLIFISKES